MTEISFYHLQRKSLDEALPELLEKVVQRGLRALVLAGSKERVDALDIRLWTYGKDSFLPHGSRDLGHPAEQPIYLTENQENPNGASVLVLVDGLALGDGAAPGDGDGAAFLAGFERCLDLFDGNDEEAVTAARRRWQAARAAGHKLTYWQQGERGWEKKAEA